MIEMLAAFLLQTAQPTASEMLRQGMTSPREFRPASQMLPDVGAAVLACYHPTGRFRAASEIQRPWQDAAQWGAERSMVLRIAWSGAMTGQSYTTDVVLMERGGMLRGMILGSTAVVPPSRRCQLEGWQRPTPP